MKQQSKILQLALFITLFTGCDVNTLVITEEPKPEELKRNEIGFNVVSQNTKSNNDTTIVNNGYAVEVKDMQNNTHSKGAILTSETITDFGVFGYSTNNTDWTAADKPNWLFDHKTEKAKNWNTHEPWADGKNSFFAYAPYKTEANGITIVSTEATAGAPTIKYVMDVAAANQPDILVATPALNKTKPAGVNQGVPMTFKHKLAAIGFRITNTAGRAIVKISVTGIKTEGTLIIDNENESKWDMSAQAGTSSLMYAAGVNTTATGDHSNITEAQLMKSDGYLMLLPQIFEADAKLMVVSSGGEFEYNLNDFTTSIEAGKQYTYVLELPPPPPPVVNCYIATPGEVVKFNAKTIGRVPSGSTHQIYNPNIAGAAGYGVVDGNTITINPLSIALKWQTAHGRISSANTTQMLIPADGITYDPATGECSVTTNNSIAPILGGSAYICAYDGADGTGNILWSWHIWVVNKTDNPLETIHIKTAINDDMMDRALGAITTTAGVNSFGMHYQWGRKDPFTPSVTTGNGGTGTQLYDASGNAINTNDGGMGGDFKFDESTKTSINDLIQNPSTFYTKGNSTNYVPIASTGNRSKDWWNSEIKTMYDPCPYGYKVPQSETYETKSDWSKLKWSGAVITAGQTYKLSFFPASGSRNGSSGNLDRVGINGYCWMSTPAGEAADGYNLTFYSNYTNPNLNNIRAYGFPIRCVKI